MKVYKETVEYNDNRADPPESPEYPKEVSDLNWYLESEKDDKIFLEQVIAIPDSRSNNSTR